MSVKNIGTIISIITAIWTFPASATTFFVATNGSDSNPGTSSASPWATFQRAADTAVAGDVVNFADGTYSENPTINRSGTAASPITFQATGSGAIIFTDNGVLTVTGNYINLSGFTFHSGNNSASSTSWPGAGIFSYSAGCSGTSITVSNFIWEDSASPSFSWSRSDAGDYAVCMVLGNGGHIT